MIRVGITPGLRGRLRTLAADRPEAALARGGTS